MQDGLTLSHRHRVQKVCHNGRIRFRSDTPFNKAEKKRRVNFPIDGPRDTSDSQR